MRGLADVAAGRTKDADAATARLQQRLATGRSIDAIGSTVLRYESS
jgi:hypothetical protein